MDSNDELDYDPKFGADEAKFVLSKLGMLDSYERDFVTKIYEKSERYPNWNMTKKQRQFLDRCKEKCSPGKVIRNPAGSPTKTRRLN